MWILFQEIYAWWRINADCYDNIMPTNLEDAGMTRDVVKYLIITIPKKGYLKKCANYRTIRLICHSSKILLRIISNRINPQAEEIMAEFGKKRNT